MPRFDPPTTTPGGREKKRDGFQTLPSDASPSAVVDLVQAYQGGATISQLAVDFDIHRTTVAGHLDRNGVPRHSEQTTWDDAELREAAKLYTSGLSLAAVAAEYGIDAQTVANRFRRAGVPVRPRRGWTSPAHSEQEQR